MSDPDSQLTPAQDDAVRALLASAKHTDPTPPEVVARLDSALASLRAEALSTPAPVVTLASRRRRTLTNALLGAAAAVVVFFGVTQVLPSGNNLETAMDSGGSSSESAGDAVTSQEDDSSVASSQANESGAATKSDGTQLRENATAPSPPAVGELNALTSGPGLKQQARALLRNAGKSDLAAEQIARDCWLPGADASKVVSVTFDGQPGALVLREPVRGTRQVDLFLCGEAEAQGSFRIPVAPPAQVE